MQIFQAEGTKRSTDATVEINLTFPDEVDYVALSGFLNDHHICYHFYFESVNGRVWKAVCTRTGEQTEWIPRVRVLGFKVG